ncbi:MULTISPECIES: GIY-YIG nuclease family protein [unclassified Sphingobium]|uniref:GIY-YIG nuclease family protein n=1 Tax=unclassified Sphingobium TaxID=2611147 RepID=UPI0005CBEA61|nr:MULTISPECIES: GIY-YIG nuclease family protein [unclassified Sphingobium]AJR24371.1 restriction endonuclease [Sphingobium sp. YBL2]AMK16773.1 restriction enzyme [Sphingobium sp. MI1205]
MPDPFFPPKPEISPKIYAYRDKSPAYEGMLKVGFTARDVEGRVAQQYPTKRPGELPYEIVLEESAVWNDGGSFTDYDIHRQLRKKGVRNPAGEWFECDVDDVRAAVLAVREGIDNEDNRTQNFKMRPEQAAAVEKTSRYFASVDDEGTNHTPHFLWNAKMRFGKTFASYQLAKRMGWNKVLVLTFKPAVQNAWEEDLKSHIDFEGWQFVSRGGLSEADVDMSRPIVCFGSFQDFLGKNSAGGIKAKNEWVHATNWDCVIFDEYHYGAWRENAKELFEAEDRRELEFAQGNGLDYFSEENMPITTGAYLYLSGTPFRAIASGEFIEEQIYNWTYSDEQRAKEQWEDVDNPYASLPRMVMLTYQLPDAIREIAMQGEFDEFDLNVFFSADGEGDRARFKYKNEVQSWLDLIRGSYEETAVDNLRLGNERPPMPFSDVRLLNLLSHTFWYLPSVASCHAMRNLMSERQNRFYHDYNVMVCAGSRAGIGVAALQPVLDGMDDPLKSKSITLSCGKLTTGVSVKPWTGILMLRNISSPESYFQAAFRVQTPWVIQNPDSVSSSKREIVKKECYVFDFAPNRALKQVADYSCRLNVDETNPEKKVEEFIHFLPVLAYDGSSMRQIDAAGVLDMAMSGTTATLLARRWESALLVNVDNNTLQRLMNSDAAMQALMKIEGFRNLNQEIETIINKSESVKKAQAEASDRDLTAKEKKQLSEEEKEYKNARKEIQTKLVKFATRIPIFMYLTDYREKCLRDIITQLEPGLFRKVTGLGIPDFELLVSLGVFNSGLMNDAVYKFKRYEDASLSYTGLNRHEGADVGLYDTVISAHEFV